MSLWPVLSQKAYPRVGDIDDCWVVATVWAATASDPCLKKPSIYNFRRAAGNPDDPNRADGGNLTEISRAVPVIWPTADYHAVQTRYWTTFRAHLVKAHTISLAVNSAHLPSNLRFNFYGNHQVGVWRSPRTGYVYVANPLAPEGSRPIRITEAQLKYAATSLQGAAGWILAACFTPIPVHLRYGGVKTKPFPDRTRVNTNSGSMRLSPRINDDNRFRGLVKGDLFVAYQVTNTGDIYKGSRRWYGDHRGTKWIHAARLSYEGGDS